MFSQRQLHACSQIYIGNYLQARTSKAAPELQGPNSIVTAPGARFLARPGHTRMANLSCQSCSS